MIDNKRILAVIPARGGSKGLPGKNILTLLGKPLIAWTIESALNSHLIDHTIVSSDAEDIIAVAEQLRCQVPFRRPENLSGDDSSSIDVLIHALEQVPGYDYIVLLQPTSPLRTTEDIDSAIKHMFRNKASSCVSVSRLNKALQWMFYLDEQSHLFPVDQISSSPRQKLPTLFALNGAIYVINSQLLMSSRKLIHSDTVAFTMDPSHSVDIDDKGDLEYARFLLSQRKQRHKYEQPSR
ncbi:MAG: acylneuraminate cytidylyltransferase family protein [Gammaproteobacteria bacterium]|nr:acylneuraminate cytidylyltransferase family protein [Gammaproteobacteria bacterium]MDH5801332.1 acylneuraminate cytidylyltransferase family protein [Gammaproteobacteria bacterium]